MKPTRLTQPYRQSGSRAPSQTLDKMLAGRSAGVPNALMRAYAAGNAARKVKGVSVPRTVPWHKQQR